MNIHMCNEQLYPSDIALLENLTATQLVKKFTAVYGNRMFISMFTEIRHWTMSLTK
jgi:hypothetical protein